MLLHSLPSNSKQLFSTITPTITEECKSLLKAKLLHQQNTVQGFINYTNITNLITNYISCNSPNDAVLLLQSLHPSPSSVYWWNQLIKRALHYKTPHVVLQLYRRLKTLGWTPDHYTFPFVFKACGDVSSFHIGASVHGAVLRSGFDSNVFVCNAIVSMYGKCKAVINAREVFDEMCSRGIDDLVTWNSIVSAYSHGFFPNGAVLLFREMTRRGGLVPDAVSVVNVLPVCGSLGLWLCGKGVHGFSVRSGLVGDVFVGNALIDMYAKCGKMEEAGKV